MEMIRYGHWIIWDIYPATATIYGLSNNNSLVVGSGAGGVLCIVFDFDGGGGILVRMSKIASAINPVHKYATALVACANPPEAMSRFNMMGNTNPPQLLPVMTSPIAKLLFRLKWCAMTLTAGRKRNPWARPAATPWQRKT